MVAGVVTLSSTSVTPMLAVSASVCRTPNARSPFGLSGLFRSSGVHASPVRGFVAKVCVYSVYAAVLGLDTAAVLRYWVPPTFSTTVILEGVVPAASFIARNCTATLVMVVVLGLSHHVPLPNSASAFVDANARYDETPSFVSTVLNASAPDPPTAVTAPLVEKSLPGRVMVPPDVAGSYQPVP